MRAHGEPLRLIFNVINLRAVLPANILTERQRRRYLDEALQRRTVSHPGTCGDESQRLSGELFFYIRRDFSNAVTISCWYSALVTLESRRQQQCRPHKHDRARRDPCLYTCMYRCLGCNSRSVGRKAPQFILLFGPLIYSSAYVPAVYPLRKGSPALL